jgi:hypothetical protein
MVSTIRLLSTQTLDISLVIVKTSYPILDAILIFPIAIIFWTIRRWSKNHNGVPEEQEINEINRPLPLLSIAMFPCGYRLTWYYQLCPFEGYRVSSQPLLNHF